MGEYQATVKWERSGATFTDQKYSRAHRWVFDGGLTVPASASPHVVARPFTLEAAVDPEEAFVAALSSCHMLWFLSIAAGQGFVVDCYEDRATGVMAKNAEGRLAMTEVTLRPVVQWAGREPSPEALEALHAKAHEECFIANSVRTRVRVESE
ncbi:MAG TPA: OsmC family protein [Gemmatimonadales bacterium]